MRVKRRSKAYGAILLGVGGILGLIAVFSVFGGDMTEDDRRLTGRLLQTRGTPVPASDIYPGQWDYVCYLYPYSYPSVLLKRQLPQAISDLEFLPSDRYVDEERWGLAFVTRRTAEARIFLVDNQAIYRIEGPACVPRETGTFNVETVAALNKIYIQLTVAASQPR